MAERDIADKKADYQADIAHLLPAEITAFYISIKGIIPFDPKNANDTLNHEYLILSFVFAIFLAIVFYFVMPQMLRITGKSQRILYLVTFLVWIISIDIDHLVAFLQSWKDVSADVPLLARVVVNLFVALWSFSVPFLFRRINPAPTDPVQEPPSPAASGQPG